MHIHSIYLFFFPYKNNLILNKNHLKGLKLLVKYNIDNRNFGSCKINVVQILFIFFFLHYIKFLKIIN